MNIKVYKVKHRKRLKGSLKVVDYKKDFKLQPDSFIDLTAFLQMRNLSLYCIDVDKKLAAFVETPNNINLHETPFYWESQYKHAKRVYLMPFEVFLSFDYDGLNDTKSVLIYSVGRCGSTLISNIFREISGIVSISEPDVYFQISLLRRKKAIDEFEAKKLINSSTNFICKSIDSDIPKLFVIKFRSPVIKIHRDISNILPNSKNIFVYRNAEDVIQSFDRIRGYPYTKKRWLLRFPLLSRLYKATSKLYYSNWTDLDNHYNNFVKNGSPYDIVKRLGPCGIFLLEWLSKVNSYLELKEYKSDMLALRYEDLVTNPREIIRGIFDYCDISDDEVENGCNALKKDAQAGTNLARNPKPRYKLDKKDRMGIDIAIKRYTEFSGSDVVLPGTIKIHHPEESGDG